MQIKEFPLDNRYKVYSDGRILGPRGNFLKPSVNHGYHHVKLDKRRKVHRVVCETFLEKVEGCPDVNHKNGIKTDNRLENLEWTNDSLNIRHAFAIGLSCHKGEKNSRNIIPKEHIPIIREAIVAGHSPKRICKYYGVHQNTIYQIKYNKNWSHT